MYTHEIYQLRNGENMEEIVERLEDEDLDIKKDSHLENGEEEILSAEYNGRRFEYLIMGGSIVFRDYEGERVTKEDLKAFEQIDNAVEEDLKVPE